MTKRERYLKALRNEATDVLVWAPNFDYWLYVNQAEGTLPRKYRDMSRNDIVRAVGGTIWDRQPGLKAVVDPRVRETFQTRVEETLHEFHTPLGSIRELHLATRK